MVKDLISFVGDSEGVSSNPVKAILCNFLLFFLFSFLIIFYLFGFFPFILTADPLKLCEEFCDNVFLVLTLKEEGLYNLNC